LKRTEIWRKSATPTMVVIVHMPNKALSAAMSKRYISNLAAMNVSIINVRSTAPIRAGPTKALAIRCTGYSFHLAAYSTLT